jgi:hypothetical protein
MKTPVDKERTFEVNIPDSYTPFEEIACDIKTMFPSKTGYRYLLVLVCNVTRFVILIPLKSKDAMTVAEAIVQRCILIFGPFKKFVSDQGTEFSNQVIEYAFQALKVKHTFVSVGHHEANKSERFIGTVSRMLTTCLEETGDNWPNFCNAVAYSYNSFSLSILGNFSPYYLVFMRQAPTTFDCSPTLHISSSYTEYVDLLKARLEKVGKTVLDLQAIQQLEQQRKQNQKVKHPSKFCEGMLVFLLSPSTSALQTKSKKIRLDYVGPLVISSLLDRSHAVLSTLDGKQLTGIFHVCRLKVAWIRTEKGPTNMLSNLTPAEITAEHPPVIDRPQEAYYGIIRSRFTNGDLQILVDVENSKNGRQWLRIDRTARYQYLNFLTANKIRTQGSLLTFVHRFMRIR